MDLRLTRDRQLKRLEGKREEEVEIGWTTIGNTRKADPKEVEEVDLEDLMEIDGIRKIQNKTSLNGVEGGNPQCIQFNDELIKCIFDDRRRLLVFQ